MSGLIRYEAARHALAVAKQVDEVKDIRDKAQALAAYARQAKDEDMIRWATEIKLRAERRCGEILRETEKANGGRPPKTGNTTLPVSEETGATTLPVSAPTLADAGLSKRQSSDFQAVASVSEPAFEAEIATGTATTASLARKGRKKTAGTKPKKKAEPKPKVDMVPKAELDEMIGKYNELCENREDLVNELEAVESVRSDEHVVKIKQLQQELRACKSARDSLMVKCEEMQRQIGFWKKKYEKAVAK